VPGSLRKYITVVEYTKNRTSRLFYDGWNQKSNDPPDAVYAIDSSSDLQISFRPEIRELGGRVSVSTLFDGVAGAVIEGVPVPVPAHS
jgi:hypothetical protein